MFAIPPTEYKMRRDLLLPALVGLLVAGCSDAAITDPVVSVEEPQQVVVEGSTEVDCTDPWNAVYYTDICGGGGWGGSEGSLSDPSDPSQPTSRGGGTTTDPEPCDTGDEVFDDPDVQEALDDIWQASNPDATNAFDRLEQGGWILDDGLGGYSFMPLGATSKAGLAPSRPRAQPL